MHSCLTLQDCSPAKRSRPKRVACPNISNFLKQNKKDLVEDRDETRKDKINENEPKIENSSSNTWKARFIPSNPLMYLPQQQNVKSEMIHVNQNKDELAIKLQEIKLDNSNESLSKDGNILFGKSAKDKKINESILNSTEHELSDDESTNQIMYLTPSSSQINDSIDTTEMTQFFAQHRILVKYVNDIRDNLILWSFGYTKLLFCSVCDSDYPFVLVDQSILLLIRDSDIKTLKLNQYISIMEPFHAFQYDNHMAIIAPNIFDSSN